MSDYRAPVKDMRFVMDELAGYKELTQYPDFAEATPDLADAILEEAAKFAGEVLWRLPGVRETRTYAVMEEVKNSTHLHVYG